MLPTQQLNYGRVHNMKKLKIAVMSAAILIGVNHGSYAAYTQQDLDTLRELSESDNTKALLTFIRANPHLMKGENPMAKALRDFVKGRSGFMGGIFSARAPDLTNVPDPSPSVETSVQVDFGSLGDFGS